MDRYGIEREIVSLAAPCIQDEVDRARAVKRAAEANDALAAIVAKHPDRYSAFAALPMQDPQAAAAELERCIRELHFLGALVNGYSSVGSLETATEYLRDNFYVTTSGNFHTASLIGVILQLGADRVLLAVDYPFEQTRDAVEWFDTVPISEADKEKIGRTNAARLFGV